MYIQLHLRVSLPLTGGFRTCHHHAVIEAHSHFQNLLAYKIANQLRCRRDFIRRLADTQLSKFLAAKRQQFTGFCVLDLLPAPRCVPNNTSVCARPA